MSYTFPLGDPEDSNNKTYLMYICSAGQKQIQVRIKPKNDKDETSRGGTHILEFQWDPDTEKVSVESGDWAYNKPKKIDRNKIDQGTLKEEYIFNAPLNSGRTMMITAKLLAKDNKPTLITDPVVIDFREPVQLTETRPGVEHPTD